MDVKFEQLLQNINNREFKPVYWLEGEETYFIDEIADRIEATVLQPGERDFNQVILYGKEVEFKQVVDQCRQFPMMAPYRVVILREAQDMKDISALAPYLKNPSDKTVLVVQYKYRKVRKSGDLGKALKGVEYLYAKKLYDSEVPKWLNKLAKKHQLKIKPEAVMLMIELLGTELTKIANELEKLVVTVGKDKEITIDHINEYIGDSKEYNSFELNNALGVKDSRKAFRIVNYFAANPKSVFPPMVIGSLTNYFGRIWIVQENATSSDKELASLLKFNNTFFIRDYRRAAKNYPRAKLMQVFDLLEEYDLRIKGVENRSFGYGELFRELIFKILH
jgi:DNA polymerase-3 subunit delta